MPLLPPGSVLPEWPGPARAIRQSGGARGSAAEETHREQRAARDWTKLSRREESAHLKDSRSTDGSDILLSTGQLVKASGEAELALAEGLGSIA